MAMVLNGRSGRAPGRDDMFDTGLFVFNREDMSVEAMQARMPYWTPGDLFAIFRDELGGTHAQYSRFEDFSDVALTQLVRIRRGYEDVAVDRERMLRLVAILMISRIHGYTFDNFVELRDHEGRQLFDFRGLCSWIANNEEMFMTDAEATVEMDAENIEDLRADYDELQAVAA